MERQGLRCCCMTEEADDGQKQLMTAYWYGHEPVKYMLMEAHVDGSDHSHVSGIAGAQIISCKIGDSRLEGMEVKSFCSLT